MTQLLSTTIKGITKKGAAYAEINGKRVEIPYGCPGDDILLQKMRRRKGVITKIETPSAHRITPRCPHAGEAGSLYQKCGGCAFQYIDYPYQLELKHDLVVRAFSAHGLAYDVLPAIASPKTFGYRDRMDFVVGPEKQLGLREKGSWRHIVDITECHLVSDTMMKVFTAVKEWLHTTDISGWNARTNEGQLRYVVLRETKNTGELAVILISYSALDMAHIHALLELLPDTVTHVFSGINASPADISAVDSYTTLKGSDYLREEINGISYYIAPGSFFQTNMSAAEKLLELVVGRVRDIKPQKVMDLYCGSGFFALQLEVFVPEVIGVELDARAIELAKQSLRKTPPGLPLPRGGVQFIASDAIDYPLDGGYDCLIVDPPRSGLHPTVIRQIIDHRIPHIVYVSCNFTSLAQNLVALQEFYDIEMVQPIDLFPHTPHIETVVRLNLKHNNR